MHTRKDRHNNRPGAFPLFKMDCIHTGTTNLQSISRGLETDFSTKRLAYISRWGKLATAALKGKRLPTLPTPYYSLNRPLQAESPVAQLTEDVLMTMTTSKLKWTLAFVLALSLLAGDGLALSAGQQENPVSEAEQAQAERADADANKPGVDLHGDPLPKGALARLRHRGRVQAVFFSIDGKTLTSLGGDRTIQWNLADGKPIRSVLWENKIDGKTRWLAVSSHDKTMALSRSGGITLLDSAGRKVHEMTKPVVFDGNPVAIGYLSGAFSSDGKILAVGQNTGIYSNKIPDIHLWDVATGKMLRVLPGKGRPKMLHGENPIRSLAFSANGKLLAAGIGVGSGRKIRLWEVESGKEIHIALNDPSPVKALAFSPDGKTLAAVLSHGSIRLSRVATGAEKLLLTPPSPVPGPPLAFSPDGNMLAAGSWCWDLTTGEVIGKLISKHDGAIVSLAFSPDGKKLATGHVNSTCLIWSLPGLRKQLLGLPKPDRLKQLLYELDDEDFTVRERAFAELEKLGNQAVPALRQALDNPLSLETRRRIQRLLEK